MKTFKKTMAVLLSLTAIASVFAGCGNSDSTTGKNNDGKKGDGLVSVYLVSQIHEGSTYIDMSYNPNGTLSKLSKRFDESMSQLTGSSYDSPYYTETYDEDGKLLEILYYEDDQVDQHLVYEYDEQGYLVHRIQDYTDSWHFEVFYSYDENGNRTKFHETRDGEDMHIYTYAYDSENRLIKETWGESITLYIYGGNTVTTGFPKENSDELYIEMVETYDDNGNLIKEVSYDDGEPSSYTLYSYDEAGNLIKKAYFYADDTPIDYTVYSYDEKGNCTEEVSYNCDEDGDELDYRETAEYVYDENGNMVEETHYKDDKPAGHKSYTYIELRLTPEQAEALKAE